MTALSELGISVVEDEESGESAAAETDEVKARGNLNDTELNRTDDPERMYLRQMGAVSLLSREGEIATAKRIEAGREAMISGICESPLTVRAIIDWRDPLDDGRMPLRDVIDLEATYHGAAFGAVSVRAETTTMPMAFAADHGNGTEAEDVASPAGIEDEPGGEEGDGTDNLISLAAMEAQVRPGVLAIVEAIANLGSALQKLQDRRIVVLRKGSLLAPATERRHAQLALEIVELVKRCVSTTPASSSWQSSSMR